MRTMAIMNQKGGCGKTTVAINLACALTRLDRRVLLIDIDPQAHATIGLGLRSDDLDPTAYELLMDPAIRLADTIHNVRDNLGIVPAATVLAGAEQELSHKAGREERLANKLSQLDEGLLDFVIIDCPPSVGLLTFNALLAAKEVVIPVDASYFSMHGLVKLRDTLEVLEEELQHSMKVHVLCNNLDTRTHFSKELLQEIDDFHAAVLLDTFIESTVKLKEAAAKGLSIFELDSQAKVSRQFLSLAREIIEKEPKIDTDNIQEWMEKLHGPRRTPNGVLFTVDAPRAETVAVTGEFNGWTKEGYPLTRDTEDGFWKAIIPIKPGEYEYRFIVDGVWVRDPHNKDFIRNEFGQENSLLII